MLVPPPAGWRAPDLIRATGHDKHVQQDYRQCRDLGFGKLRDGVRWHLIEKVPGKYDWSSWMPALEAAERLDLQIIWDLFHYGCLITSTRPGRFPDRFTDFALAALEVAVGQRRPPAVCPLNEISFLSWAVEEEYFPGTASTETGGSKHNWSRPQSSPPEPSAANGRARRSAGPSRRAYRAARDRRIESELPRASSGPVRGI